MERKQANRECWRLRKNKGNSEIYKLEYERAWEEYKSKQRVMKHLVRKARVNGEREAVSETREEGEEEGRGGESRDTKSSEEMIVNGRSDKEKEEVKKEIGKK